MVCVLSRREGFLGPRRAVLAINAYSYVHVIDSATLIVWRQQHVEHGPSASVVIRVFRLGDLTALDEAEVAAAESLVHTDPMFSLSSAVLAECELDTAVVGSERRQSFPPPLGGVEELLILCHSSSIKDGSHLGLMVAKPKGSSFEIYPQDWFNLADIDFGYQWVTRVARNTRTGLVEGEGMRIEPFVLDRTLRSLLTTESKT